MKKRFLLISIVITIGFDLFGQQSSTISKEQLTTVAMTTTVLKNSVNNSLDVLFYNSFGKNGPNLNYPLAFKNDNLEAYSTKGGLVRVYDNLTPMVLDDDVITYTPPKGFTGNDIIIYRIKDKNGEFKEGHVSIHVFSGKTGNEKDLSNYNLENDYTLYPNPSEGNFNISMYSTDREHIEMKFFDLAGKLVLTKKFTSKIGFQNISMSSNLEPGLYIIESFSSGKKLKTKKLLLK